jgi:hypothetical protein
MSGLSRRTATDFDGARTCRQTAEQTEGPFYFDVDEIRGDTREDRDGSELRLGIRVRDAACEPLPDAVVDIWHCDAEGSYSAEPDILPPGRPGREPRRRRRVHHLELTLSEDGEAYRGRITLDVARA